MKNDNFKSFAALVLICITVAVLMGTVNYFTSPIIEKNEKEKITNSLLFVMPDGEGFEEVEFSSLPASVKQVYKEKNGGYVFKLVTSGYSSGLTVMCGVNADGKVTGAECISSGETLGKEKTYGSVFNGCDSESVSSIDTVSGATLTTKAYKNAVADALAAFDILTKEAAANE